MTKSQILATGFFRIAPNACSLGRLDWHTQKYENYDGDQIRTGPGLTNITLTDGKPYYIDPSPGTRTDKGIRAGSTLRDLKAAYGSRLRLEPNTGFPDEDNYGVSGKSSHLVFYVRKGTVEGFYLTQGAIAADEDFYADMRGIAC